MDFEVAVMPNGDAYDRYLFANGIDTRDHAACGHHVDPQAGQLTIVCNARLLLFQQLPADFGYLPFCRVNTAALLAQ